jgi:hypothetical protein
VSQPPDWQAPTFEPSAGTMSIEDVNDFLGVNPTWWRPRKEWHHGWADHELEWIAAGRPYPEHWEYHRKGTPWEDLSYGQVRECYAAGHGPIEYMLWRAESGHVSVARTCTECGEKLSTHVGNKELRGHGLERGDLTYANSGREAKWECSRCGSVEDVQYHHWAPRHLFPHDFDTWPGDTLCQLCHQLWHQVVTPKMNQRKTA